VSQKNAPTLKRDFMIIQSSLESTFELLEFLLDKIFVTKFTD